MQLASRLLWVVVVLVQALSERLLRERAAGLLRHGGAVLAEDGGAGRRHGEGEGGWMWSRR
jgi:hypothetical protein